MMEVILFVMLSIMVGIALFLLGWWSAFECIREKFYDYHDLAEQNIDLRDSNRYLEKKNIDLEAKVNALDKECQMYLDEAVEIAEEKNGIAKYADFLIKQYEEVYEEKRKLEWENERLREQVEFFERELSGEEAEKKEK